MKKQKRLSIKNKLGLHVRPAALFVHLANSFESEIIVRKGNIEVDGKSILGVMMLAAGKGSKILVTANGPDAGEAIVRIEKLVEDELLKENEK